MCTASILTNWIVHTYFCEFGWPPTKIENSGWPPTKIENFGRPPTKIKNFGWPPTKIENFGRPPTKIKNFGWPPNKIKNLVGSQPKLQFWVVAVAGQNGFGQNQIQDVGSARAKSTQRCSRTIW